MKKFSGLFLLIVIANCANAQGVTKHGEITSGVPTEAATGDMLYWNGSAWVKVTAGTNGQTLTFYNGAPVWTGTISYANTVTSANSKIWMDRNLGATKVATGSTDTASYGDLYQWGRGADGHQIRTSGTTPTLSSADVPGHGSFITTSANPEDWRSPKNDDLWQGVNGINNPCPSGYRIPTVTELNNERLSWGSSQNPAGAIASPLKLPLAGLRSYNGSLNNVGTGGDYWSSTVSGANAQFLYFSTGTAGWTTLNRAYGFSVRCLKDY